MDARDYGRQPTPAVIDPQHLVARARAGVLGGRGPGATAAETARHQRERPTLGALPAPLARELVHLDACRCRTGSRAAQAASLDRVREVWGSGPVDAQRLETPTVSPLRQVLAWGIVATTLVRAAARVARSVGRHSHTRRG